MHALCVNMGINIRYTQTQISWHFEHFISGDIFLFFKIEIEKCTVQVHSFNKIEYLYPSSQGDVWRWWLLYYYYMMWSQCMQDG